MRSSRSLVSVAFVLFLLASAFGQSADLATIPRVVKYTGAAPAGASSVTFAIYDREDAFAPLWLETQAVTADDTGHYTVLLGSTKSDGLPASIFSSGEARWIAVKVGDAPESARTLLVSVPYALKAGDAETLGGKPLSAFLLADASASSASAASPSKSQRLKNSAEASRANPDPTAPPDSGTQNHLAKFLPDGVTLGDSALVEVSGRLGIGTTFPNFPLELVGSNVELLQRNPSPTGYSGMRFYNDQNNASHALEIDYSGTAYPGALIGAGPAGEQTSITNNGPYPMTFGTNNIARVTIAGSGNVGIGTSTPNFPLELVGSNVAFLQRNPSATSYAGMRFYNDQNNALRALEIDYSGSAYPGALIGGGPSGEQTSITNNGPYPMSFGTNNTARITILGSGNVGVGTSSPSTTLDVAGIVRAGSGVKFGDNTVQTTAATITGVTAGTGLTGGGTSGIVNLAVDATAIQARVTGTCSAGQYVQVIAANGSVTCGVDQTGAGGVASVAATSGGGIVIAGTATNPTVGLTPSCTSGQVLTWSGTTWQCTTPAGGGGVTLPFSGSGSNSTNIFAITQHGTGITNPDPLTNVPPAGVFGFADSSTGFTAGVLGKSTSPNGLGVLGIVTGGPSQENSAGVIGIATSTTGKAIGVSGQSSSPSGIGGDFSNADLSGAALRAEVGGQGQNSSPVAEFDVTGTSINLSASTINVQGPSGPGANIQLGGPTTVTGPLSTQSITGVGSPLNVIGGMNVSSGGASVTGSVTITGNLSVSGNFSKGGGTFKIDHPLDPSGKYLYHSFVESPDMMNIYNGVIALDSKGQAWIVMPDYFEALNMEFRYQLTSIGRPAPNLYVRREMAENKFMISGGPAHGKVSWQVTGIRHDAWADAHRIKVEEVKPPTEQGTYLHPELFTKSGSDKLAADNHK